MTPRFLFRPAARAELLEARPGLRRAVLLDFPYSLFYRVKPDMREILAVFHHRRDPRVWQVRAAE